MQQVMSHPRSASSVLGSKNLMTASGLVLSGALMFDFVAPAVTALSVLCLVGVVLAVRSRWGKVVLGAESALVLALWLPQLASKGVMPSAYGIRDFVGVVVGALAAAVTLFACIAQRERR
jgi:hypothetical protein